MEEALTALLTGDAGLSALVGERIDWGVMSHGRTARPYLVLQLVAEPRAYHAQGEVGLVDSTVQADAWADTKASSLAVRRALLDRVSGYRGTVSGVAIRGIFVVATRDDTDRTAAGELLHRSSIDMRIVWRTT